MADDPDDFTQQIETQRFSLREDDEDDDDIDGNISSAKRRNIFWGRLIPMNCESNQPLLFNEKESYIIGRGSSVDFSVPNNHFVSAEHCRIFRIDDGLDQSVMIEDCSTNGTFLNGKRLGKNQKTLLVHGTEISLGKVISSQSDSYYIFQAGNNLKSAVATPSSQVEKRYDLLNEIGRGNFSIVRLAVDKQTGRKCAVKVIDKRRHLLNSKVITAFQREIDILKSLEHPNVVAFLDCIEENGTIYLVQELVSGGDLLQYVVSKKRLDEAEARVMFLQMVQVLKYLKEKQITHRDLKPDNFLLTEDKVLKLADFGLAKGFEKDIMNTVCGTPIYLAPEILTSRGRSYDCRVDVYSTGVILFFLLSGKVPFSEVTQTGVYSQICRGDVDWSSEENGDWSWNDVSGRCKRMIKGLMRIEVEERIKLEDIEIHEWIVGSAEDEKVLCQLIPIEGKGGTLDLVIGRNAIGRRGDNDITIPDSRVSNFHCVLEVTKKHETFLEDKSSNGMYMNGEKIIGRKLLEHGDMLLFAPGNPKLEFMYCAGDVKFRKRKASNDEEKPQTETFESGPNSPKMITLGRSPDCTIKLRHPSVSSVHCKLYFNEETLIEDLSSNGTYVNKDRMKKGVKIPLHHGDTVSMFYDKGEEAPVSFQYLDR
ncbi:Checkpoint kinase 2 [Blyttiomyces sp. JEL0837]|nr:Checkpoint kinase 2 [Blyttiomyces sp. JEL0837]